jgi:hypothetical protein
MTPETPRERSIIEKINWKGQAILDGGAPWTEAVMKFATEIPTTKREEALIDLCLRQWAERIIAANGSAGVRDLWSRIQILDKEITLYREAQNYSNPTVNEELLAAIEQIKGAAECASSPYGYQQATGAIEQAVSHFDQAKSIARGDR